MYAIFHKPPPHIAQDTSTCKSIIHTDDKLYPMTGICPDCFFSHPHPLMSHNKKATHQYFTPLRCMCFNISIRVSIWHILHRPKKNRTLQKDLQTKLLTRESFYMYFLFLFCSVWYCTHLVLNVLNPYLHATKWGVYQKRKILSYLPTCHPRHRFLSPNAVIIWTIIRPMRSNEI